MLAQRRCYDTLMLLLLLLLRMHRRLLWLGWLRLLLLLVHQVLLRLLHGLLLLLLLLLMLQLLLLGVCLLSLHVWVLGMHLVVHRRVDEGRTVGTVQNAALVVDRRRLELARGVDDRCGGGVSVDGRIDRSVSHVADHTGRRRARPVAGHVHAVLLLLLVVGRVTYVHAVIGWKSGIGHARLLTGGGVAVATVVSRHAALAQHARIAWIRGLLGLLLLHSRLALLRHLHSCSIVLMLLVRMVDPAVTQIRDVRVRKVRTHAMVTVRVMLMLVRWLLLRPVYARTLLVQQLAAVRGTLGQQGNLRRRRFCGDAFLLFFF